MAYGIVVMAVNMVETTPTADSLADKGSKLTSLGENVILKPTIQRCGAKCAIFHLTVALIFDRTFNFV